MISPIYLEYLRGERELDCSVWGSPVYGPQGWSGPCYLLNYRLREELRSAAGKYGLGKLRARAESAVRELPVPLRVMRPRRCWE